MLPIILGLVGSYLIVDSQKDKFEDGGSVKSDLHNKFGEENSKLVNFDLNKLDSFEEMQYENFSKSMSKAEALQILINNVEGDYSQLSDGLAEIAEEQSPSDEFADGGKMAKGGKIKVGDILTANTGVKVKVVEYDPKFGGRVKVVRMDEYGTDKPSQFMPLKKFKFADGGKM